GKSGHKGLFTSRLKSCRVFPIDNNRTGLHDETCIGIQRDRQFPPMHQIGTNRVTPMTITPVPAVRIMLIVEMILTIIEHRVRIVHPTPTRGEMKLRTTFLTIEIFVAFDLV